MSPSDHVVQFYRHEDELIEHAGDYLLESLLSGGAVVVVATADHRAGFEAYLCRAGLDMTKARSAGAYLAVDASSALDEFTVAGRPDPRRFERAIGHLIQQAGRGGRAVRVYGEMVALLWDAGLVNAAIDVETMWNDLSGRYAFSLLCAYMTQSVTDDDQAEALAETCLLHSAIVGNPPPGLTGDKRLDSPGEASLSCGFPATLNGPRAARRFVLETLRHWRADKFANDAAIVVTELATNAVVHARSAFTVEISAAADTLRISVRDAGPLPLAVPGGLPLPVSLAHGLGVVATVARSWGAEPLASGGKAVWAELRR